MCKILEELKQEFVDKAIKKIAIVTHDNPDPDCIASAMGTSRLIQSWNSKTECRIVYSGEISHPQNKTMVNVLNINLVRLSDIENFDEEFEHVIVVDSIPERCLPGESMCLATIDHHRSETKRSKLSDIRQVGATSSVIWEYLIKDGFEFQEGEDKDEILATALIVGIKTDTSNFVGDNVTDLDFDAFKYLLGFANRRHLSAIDNYPIPPYHFELRSQLDQEDNIKIDNGVFVGGIGYISPTKRDVLPSMAEERARVEGIDTSFVFAIVGNNIEVSVRSSGLAVDVNSLCQKIFGRDFAGGKMGSGAAKIPMGYLCINPSKPDIVKNKMWDAVKAFMIDKIFHIVNGNED